MSNSIPIPVVQFKLIIDEKNNIVTNKEYNDQYVDVDPKHITELMCRDIAQIILYSISPDRSFIKSFDAFIEKLESRIRDSLHWSKELLLKLHIKKLAIFDPRFKRFNKKAIQLLNNNQKFNQFKQQYYASLATSTSAPPSPTIQITSTPRKKLRTLSNTKSKSKSKNKSKTSADKRSNHNNDIDDTPDVTYQDYIAYLYKNKLVNGFELRSPLPQVDDIKLTPEMIEHLKRRVSYESLTKDKLKQRMQTSLNGMGDDYEYRYFYEAKTIEVKIQTPDINTSFYLMEPVLAPVIVTMDRRIVRKLYGRTLSNQMQVIISHEQEITLPNCTFEFAKINVMTGSCLDPHRSVRRRDGLITSINDYEPKTALYAPDHKIPWDTFDTSIEPNRSCIWTYHPKYNPYKSEPQQIEINIRGEDLVNPNDLNKQKQYAILPAPLSCRYIDPADQAGMSIKTIT